MKDTFILYAVILTVMCIFGVFAYLLYITFTTNLYLGILTFIIEFGVLAWFAD